MSAHPHDIFITVFGRKPVMEALADESLAIDKVLVAQTARGDDIDEIIGTARARHIQVRRVEPREVTRLSKSQSQDQGVVADVRAPKMEQAADWFARLNPNEALRLIALDGITMPANVGMIIRSATAAGMDGIVLPHHGTSGINPLVVKASAGMVFRARLLRCEHLTDALEAARNHDIAIVGLEAGGSATLFDAALPPRAVYVVGNESLGLSSEVKALVTHSLQIPMAADVESLNVAIAASLICFETMRR